MYSTEAGIVVSASCAETTGASRADLKFKCDRDGDTVNDDDLEVHYDHLEVVGFIANSTTYVAKGTKIAESGNENDKYDPHLHFGTRALRGSTTTQVWMRNEPYYRSVSSWSYGKDLDFISNINWNTGNTLTASVYTMSNGSPDDVPQGNVVVFHRLNGTSTWSSATMTKSGSLKNSVFSYNLSNNYSTGNVINVMIRATRPSLSVYDDAFMIPKYAQTAENPNSTANKYDYYQCTIGGSCSAIVTTP